MSDTLADPDLLMSRRTRYWAFISYSHRDTAVAVRLHRALETYRVPRALIGRRIDDTVVSRRLAPVFRDRDELPSSGKLSDAIHRALTASRTLIVICSPSAAASRWVDAEIRLFKTSGQADRVLPFIRDGDLDADVVADWFPPSLRHDLRPDGSLSDTLAEPLAADARRGRDGWDAAVLKIIAGILRIGFDDLRRREAARARARRLRAAGLAGASVLAGAVAYVSLADLGARLPGGRAIQRQLDLAEVTVFRPVPSTDDLRAAADALIAQIRPRLLSVRPNATTAWDLGQIVAALSASDPTVPGAPPDGAAFDAILLDMVEDGTLSAWDRAGGGFSALTPSTTGHRPDLDVPRAEHALWSVWGLAEAIGRQTGETRARMVAALDVAQTAMDGFHHLPPGGWHGVSNARDTTDAPTNVTVLALDALAATYEAGQGWHGDRSRLVELIHAAMAHLVEGYDEEGGWRRNAQDDQPINVDLTLMAFGALARAANALGETLPPRIAGPAVGSMKALLTRPYAPPNQDIIVAEGFSDQQGRLWSTQLASRLLWYPYALRAVADVMRQKIVTDDPVAIREMRRALGHLLIGLRPDTLADMTSRRTLTFVVSETLLGVGEARRRLN